MNYLIAIVSDSYARIIENRVLAVQDGRHELNGDILKSIWLMKAPKNRDFIIMATELGSNEGGGEESAWEGAVGTIKKAIKKQQKRNTGEYNELKTNMTEIKEQLDRIENQSQQIDEIYKHLNIGKVLN